MTERAQPSRARSLRSRRVNRTGLLQGIIAKTQAGDGDKPSKLLFGLGKRCRTFGVKCPQVYSALTQLLIFKCVQEFGDLRKVRGEHKIQFGGHNANETECVVDIWSGRVYAGQSYVGLVVTMQHA